MAWRTRGSPLGSSGLICNPADTACDGWRVVGPVENGRREKSQEKTAGEAEERETARMNAVGGGSRFEGLEVEERKREAENGRLGMPLSPFRGTYMYSAMRGERDDEIRAGKGASDCGLVFRWFWVGGSDQ